MHDVQSHESQGMPKFLIVRPMVKSEKISTKDQQDYWPGVGMYVVKHSCINLVDMTRKLSKVNHSANPVA